VVKVGERLAVNKPRSHRFHMERFNLKKLNKAEDKKRYRTEVPNRFAAWKIWTLEVEIKCLRND
jgi:hypothetical protein